MNVSDQYKVEFTRNDLLRGEGIRDFEATEEGNEFLYANKASNSYFKGNQILYITPDSGYALECYPTISGEGHFPFGKYFRIFTDNGEECASFGHEGIDNYKELEELSDEICKDKDFSLCECSDFTESRITESTSELHFKFRYKDDTEIPAVLIFRKYKSRSKDFAVGIFYNNEWHYSNPSMKISEKYEIEFTKTDLEEEKGTRDFVKESSDEYWNIYRNNDGTVFTAEDMIYITPNFKYAIGSGDLSTYILKNSDGEITDNIIACFGKEGTEGYSDLFDLDWNLARYYEENGFEVECACVLYDCYFMETRITENTIEVHVNFKTELVFPVNPKIELDEYIPGVLIFKK